MSADGFDTSWLKERFTYDNAARSPEVEQAFVKHFQSKEKLYLVDIGSGTGANALYFMERLFKHQDWTLIEKDAQLCKATRARVIRFLEDYNFYYRIVDDVFQIKIWDYRVKLRILNASFFDLKDLVDLEETDVVLAAAVFDLLTIPQFNEMAESIFGAKVALLATMNYQAMRFAPSEASDVSLIQDYEGHMRREQAAGKSMGPDCNGIMNRFFQDQSLAFTKGQSRWTLEGRAKKMHTFLLQFMQDSLTENPPPDFNLQAFDDWLANKRNQSKAGQLKIEVDHFDYFVSG